MTQQFTYSIPFKDAKTEGEATPILLIAAITDGLIEADAKEFHEGTIIEMIAGEVRHPTTHAITADPVWAIVAPTDDPGETKPTREEYQANSDHYVSLRRIQIKYFKTKDKGLLIQSKALEASLDRRVAELRRREKTGF